jgi:hypothetical protein
MAVDPIALVKRQWATALQGEMPSLTDGSETVPVTYGYPGDKHVAKEAVFFHGGDTEYEVHSLRADRRRRLIHASFDVIVQVRQAGASNNDEAQDDGPQFACDTRCWDLWQLIDEHIADEEHLASPELVDVAWVVSTRLEYGTYDLGVWSRLIGRIRFDARIL